METLTTTAARRSRRARRLAVGLAIPALAIWLLLVLPDPAPDGSIGAIGTTTTSEPGATTTVPATAPTTTVPPAPPPDQATLDAVALQVVPVAAAAAPTAIVPRPGTSAMYVAERAGTVRVLVDGELGEPVLDLTGNTSVDGENGLLSLAFSLDGSLLYAKHNDGAGVLQVVEYRMAGDGVDPGSRRVLLTVEKDEPIHNGGNLWVDASGLLWVSFGDGGPAKDPPEAAQRLDTLLGKLLRIDPRPTGDQPYAIPEGNPFAGVEGARPEIWAYGLRNPWRWAFDAATGDLWIGDVGRYHTEEVDLLPAGGPGTNLGWPLVEGNGERLGAAPVDHLAPVLTYPHEGDRCSVTGGYVYRGKAIAGLPGAYMFADYCEGRVRAISVVDGAVVAERAFDAVVPQLASFGQDAAGELWVLSIDGTIAKLTPT